MGAGQSTTEARSVSDSDVPKYGFHILKIEPNSPAFQAKLIPYFDYITNVNGVDVISESPNIVAEMAKNHVGRGMKMTVYNSRFDSLREITIIPGTTWGGKTLLGCSIRFCQYNNAVDRFWHVLDVQMDSPAMAAGFIPGKDWIIGSPEVAIVTQDDFYNLMIHNRKRPVRLILFNIDTDSCREATIVPDFEWGGVGCLGCDVGGGILHRIPTQRPISTNSEFKGESVNSGLGVTSGTGFQSETPLYPTEGNNERSGISAVEVFPVLAQPQTVGSPTTLNEGQSQFGHQAVPGMPFAIASRLNEDGERPN